VKYAFIARECRQHSIMILCRVLKVSRSGFYSWRGRAPSAREREGQRLLSEIQRVHREHRQACGAVKTGKALRREGIACGKHRVARLRKLHGIEANRKRRFRVITEHHQTPLAAPDRLNRTFTATAPDRA
jgi:hypothetical protein